MTMKIFIIGCIALVAVVHQITALPKLRNSSPILRIHNYLEVATTKEFAQVEARKTRFNRNILVKEYRWPKNVVPYHIWTQKGEGSFKAGGESYQLIKKSIKEIEEVSCVKFQELKYSEVENIPLQDYLKIFSADESKCRTVSPGYGLGSAMFLKDSVSSTGSPNDNHCMTSKTVIHELLHVLGFLHEHQRADRDKYIRILGENVKKENLIDFKINRDFRGSTSLGATYDRLSIMHYGNKDFSKNGENTMVWRDDEKLELGGAVMSELDKLQLNTYYECKNFPTLKPVPDVGQCPQSACVGKEDGFYPHATNKHLYIKCDGGKATCQPCFPQNSVFVNRCGICMASDTEPCSVDHSCPKDMCKAISSNGLFAHVHQKNMYVSCYFGQNFGCYECPDQYDFDDVQKKCIWKPNLNLS